MYEIMLVSTVFFQYKSKLHSEKGTAKAFGHVVLRMLVTPKALVNTIQFIRHYLRIVFKHFKTLEGEGGRVLSNVINVTVKLASHSLYKE